MTFRQSARKVRDHQTEEDEITILWKAVDNLFIEARLMKQQQEQMIETTELAL